MAIRRLAHPHVIAFFLIVAWISTQWSSPIVEDSLFWWVPKGILAAESGFHTSLAHTLPEALRAGLSPGTTPHQWADGLPDYHHPPLWYFWLGLFLQSGPSINAIRIATLLPAVIAILGFSVFASRLGSRWAALALFGLPPVLAQMLRPELDLPLLAVVPWALVAIVDQKWGRFACLGLLAPWIKEPGVLLVMPALWACWQDRRFRWQALMPVVGLLAWGGVAGGLAQPERLPTSVGGYLIDVRTVLQILLLEQGRWLLLCLIGLACWRRRPQHPGPTLPAQARRAFGVATTLALVWLLFFAAVGFFANAGQMNAHTHVRYFVPGLAVGAVTIAAILPWGWVFCLPGLLWLHSWSTFGPESSLAGIDVAKTHKASAPWIQQQISAGESVWVGSYMAAALTQPWAGVTNTPLSGFTVFGPQTPLFGDPKNQTTKQLVAGSIVMVGSYGEPAGALLHDRQWTVEASWRVADATLEARRILANDEPDKVDPR